MQVNQKTTALWLYLWFLDKMTRIDPKTKMGVVLGGKPIKLEEINLSHNIKTIRKMFQVLQENGYIVTRRTPYGRVVWVTKAKKIFGQKVSADLPPSGSSGHPTVREDFKEKKQQSGRSDGNNLVGLGSESGRSNKTIQVDNTVDTVANATFSFEEELKRLKESRRYDFKVIALYWKKKGLVFENPKQFNSNLKRELRPAKALTGYTGEQVLRAINYCMDKYAEVGWTLETVGKRIADIVNKQ